MHFELLTPRIPKHYLLLVAAIVWTFAGGMLLFRGYSYLMNSPRFVLVKLCSCLLGGLLFFRFLFDRISKKHMLRIENLNRDSPCLFSFFNLKSYLLMVLMISMGITLRKTGAVSTEYLSLLYLTMGIPLLLSSVRFYFTFLKKRIYTL